MSDPLRTQAHEAGSPETVTVIIPSFNYGHYVCDAVDSALQQTYRQVEIIVVDDGSTDDTRSRLERYGDRIRYIYQSNHGLSAARNTGIREASGIWTAFLDADDVWHRQKLEVQLSANGQARSVFFVGSPAAEVLPSVLEPAPDVRPLSVSDFLTSTPFGPSSVVVRRECFSRVGYFDETLTSAEDRDMWLRLALRYPVVSVLSPCWYYRRHSSQMTRNPKRTYDNYTAVLSSFFERHPEYRSQCARAWAHMHLDAAASYLESNNRPRAALHLAKSLVKHPSPLTPGTLRPHIRARISVRLIFGPSAVRIASFVERKLRGSS